MDTQECSNEEEHFVNTKNTENINKSTYKNINSYDILDNEHSSKPLSIRYKVSDEDKDSSINKSDKVIVNDKEKMVENKECEVNGCSMSTCGMEKLYPVLDPRFNMREVSKQCLLLEDHLNNDRKRCFDCIRKHFLIVDGLLEEAISLEKDLKERDMYRKRFLDWVELEKYYSRDPRNGNVMDIVSKNIRVFRKPLVEQYFDIVSEYP
jgi:hypothetical protein